MIEIIDQSWVFAWQNTVLTQEEANAARRWLRATPEELIDPVKRFPPLCIVRGTRAMEVPYLFTVGIVVGYLPDGKLLVKQEPETDAAQVAQEDLQVVGFWRGLTPSITEQFLPQRTPHAQSP